MYTHIHNKKLNGLKSIDNNPPYTLEKQLKEKTYLPYSFSKKQSIYIPNMVKIHLNT